MDRPKLPQKTLEVVRGFSGGFEFEGGEIRGRSLNNTLSHNTGGGTNALPKIQTPSNLATTINYSKGAKDLKPSVLDLSLEIRSKEAMQSMTGSVRQQKQSTPQKQRGAYLPTISNVMNSSPQRRRQQQEESDYFGTQHGGDTLNITKNTFSTKSGAGLHHKGRSVEPPQTVKNAIVAVSTVGRTVQFKEEPQELTQQTLLPLQQMTQFGNYLMKVVQSVERRKKRQQQGSQKLAALMDAPDSAPGSLALQNFNNQIIPDKLSSIASGEVAVRRKLSTRLSGQIDEKNFSEIGGSQIQQYPNLASQKSGGGAIQSSDISTAGSQLKNNQVAVVGFKSVFAEPKATEQVAFLLKEAQRKDKIFIPLERAPEMDSSLLYKEMKNAPDNHAGIVVFSKQGFVTVGRAKGATSNFISNEEFITEGVNKYILKDIPFFKKFHAMKAFKQWRYIMKWNAFTRKRLALANSLHLAKPIFSERYASLTPILNNIRTLPLIEIKSNVTYGKKQQQLLEEKCLDQLLISKGVLNTDLKKVQDLLEALKDEIIEDDYNYEYAVKERRMMEKIKSSKHGGEDLIIFSKARRQKEMDEEQFRILKQRHALYDRFVQFVMKIVCANLLEAQYENKRIFKEIFRDQKLGPQFEVAVCFNEKGVLDTDPSMLAHQQSFLNVFTNIEIAIYQNQSFIDFINDLVSLLFTELPIYYKPIFEHMKKIMNENILHVSDHNLIFDTLDKDILRCREYLEKFVNLQEIYDFSIDWDSNQRDKQISLEMSFYKETWLQMDKYALMVDEIPTSNTKLGTILVETLSLKKYLEELPKKVIDSIRSNVTNTMETETKSLREELSKTSEILDQLPGSLNVYVEQVNTLKYVKEKQEEFSQKFSTINKLHQLCKQDNIKVSLNLQQAIDEVSHLYETLPKLQKRAQDGLNSNKDTMEKIMHSSSLVLSKKIKAFEKKYVETYLQDRSRIEDCADTLEELFKRSKAIHEIRSKVILYKEFLKLLYEDDPLKDIKMQNNKLQCSEDYEFVADIHKQTIKLWKMLLYWRKRRHMCYNTPFLTLDMNKIIRSINKINRYFEEKLSKNDFLKEKSRPLYKVVMLQVKETSLIIEFLKDLRRESLQQRHWLQIFNLIKAPHLKNSVTFTIVNLREFHIQNYREEIGKIIEHANTELKYERVFKSIKDEWDKHELKIIPYKETMDSYILVNTETLSTAIEENLTTLENISQSKYAIHIKHDIEEQIKSLKLMLKNLEIWVNAQHHWINLDPILQSSVHLADVLRNDAMGIGFGLNSEIDQQTSEFLDLRNQFKRIMWSSFKKAKATYNLMIKSRIEVFEKLIKHFSVLQKKVHDYLDQRRRAFPRFFFLTDNQFLEFLTLANSNQDFNEYINVLFQGAHKLYINRVLGKEQMQETGKIETFMADEIRKFDAIKDEQAANLEANMGLALSQPNPLLAIKQPGGSIILSGKGGISLITKPIEEDEESVSDSMLSSERKPGTAVLSEQSQGAKSSMKTSLFGGMLQQIKKPADDEVMITKPGEDLLKVEPKKDKVSQSFEVLGMISMNKEMFLFERAIPMADGVEAWLSKVERAMQETISKALNFAVSSFPTEPLDEWVLDYPQQIILTTLHLILSHEINEVLEQVKEKQEQHAMDHETTSQDLPSAKTKDIKDKLPEVTKERSDNRNPKQAEQRGIHSQKSAMSKQSSGSSVSGKGSKKSEEEEEDPAMADYIKRKNELKLQQMAEDEEARKRMMDENRKKFEANELPKDPEYEKRKFLDEMFGVDFPLHSRLLIEDIQGLGSKDPAAQDSQPQINEKQQQHLTTNSNQKALKLLANKKVDFKEIVMFNLHRKSLQGVNLRVHFWINKIIRSLYRQLGTVVEKQLYPSITLNSIQRIIMKSIVSFLLYQRDIVDGLMNKNVQEIEDFEWQSQIRLFWTGAEPACKVICGGWTVQQQNEYLGTLPRLVLTPLTNRYFVFISSALREKSAVLFNNSESSNSIAGDIFEEMSNMCMTPFKKVVCTPVLQLKPIMQSLNGAALSAFWLFYENIDKLQPIFLQSLNREIQMLQQQFIISELVGGDIPDTHNLIQMDMQLSNRSSVNVLEGGQDNTISQGKIKNIAQQFASHSDIGSERSQQQIMSHRSSGRTLSFGIFATMSTSAFTSQNGRSGPWAEAILSSLSASFRVLSFCRFNERILFVSILKTEGFYHYQMLSRLSFEYLTLLYESIYVDEPKNAHSEKHLLSVRDLRLVVKLACLLRDQEQKIYYGNLMTQRESQLTESLKHQYSKSKNRQDRMREHEQSQKDNEFKKIEERRIEVKSIQEGLRLVCRQKLFAIEWEKAQAKRKVIEEREIKDETDQYYQMDAVEKQIQKCMDPTFEKQKRDDDEEEIELKKRGTLQSSIAAATQVYKSNKLISLSLGGPMVRKKSISNIDVMTRFSFNAGLSELKHSHNKITENKVFIETVTQVLKDLIGKLNYEKSNAQLRNCINVMDLFRRTKAIAFVGPTCSGKTTTLKIVSNALHVAFKVKLRTSVVNTATMTPKELYGSIEAFNKIHRIGKPGEEEETDSDFSKTGIFKIILDVFDKEKITNAALEEPPKVIQSIFFDSCNIDQPLSECLLDFIEKTNKREVLRTTATEFLMDFSLSGEIKAPISKYDERIPVTLPNGNVLQFPSDLFLFFETPNLRDASPPFISKVGLIITEEDDVTWHCLFERSLHALIKKQAPFFEENKMVRAKSDIKECVEEFLMPFLEKVTQHPRISAWAHFNPKSATLQLFNLLKCVLYKLKDVIKQREIEEDEQYKEFLLECQRDIIWSNVLLCTVWSFGALLPRELRRPFEEQFAQFKKKFNFSMSQSATAQSAGVRSRYTLFDIYFDPESLQWELLQENIDYKLKLQFDPLSNHLMVPTVEASQCFFMLDMLVSIGTKYEDNVVDNKHFRALGPGGSGKSFAINAFFKRVHGDHKFQLIQVPMSAYVTIEKIKETVESYYLSKRRNLLEPKDKERSIVLMIDDVHLQTNLNVNILEFLRTWCMSKGYYDIQQGFFKGVGHFTTVTAENSEYRRSEQTQFPGRPPLSSRFLFYANTIYLDEPDAGGIDRYKAFTQQWFTSKLWSTSRLLNKYYILISNTALAFIDKLRRLDPLHNSSIHRLTSFHFFQKFCSNLVAYTVTMDDQHDFAVGQKEEEVVSNLMVYELMRMYGDRQHKATCRTTLMQKLIECCRQEFIGRGALTQQHLDGLILGNYHERRSEACVKYLYVNPANHKDIKEELRKKLRVSSNNQFLEAHLEAPNAVKDIFRISRILFKDMQHTMLVGHAGGGKLEYLQLAAVLNDALILEINCPRLSESSRFVEAFKKIIVSVVGLDRSTFIMISDQQLRDPIYIDYVNNFMINCCNKFETTVLWSDNEFKQALIDIEKVLYQQAPIKRAAEPTEDQLFTQAMRKIQKHVHIAFLIDDFQTYFEWVSLFPSIETNCEVMFMDELNTEGYKQFTSGFFQQRGTDNSLFSDQKLMSALVEMRQIIKNNVVNIFYSPQMLKNTCTEELLATSLTEFIFSNEEKLNGYMFADGNFEIKDPCHRQYNYNLPVDISTLYKARYVMFLELFRYLYDLMALGLVVRRNYYEAFLRKAGEFTEFFKDIKVTKKTLHGQSSTVSSRVSALKDKVAKLKQLIEERERLISKKTIELQDVESDLSLNEEEVDKATDEKDSAINEVLTHFEKVTGSEFIYVLSQFTKFQDKETHVLNTVAILIEKNGKADSYNKKEHSMYFSDRDELIALLDDRRNFNYDEGCFNKFKDFIGAYSVTDFKDKPLFKLMYQYFVCLFKKLNLRNTMANTYARIKGFTQQLEMVQSTLTYSKNYIKEKKHDLEDAEINYKKVSQQERDLSMKIEEAEISHMRTEHIIESIEAYAQKMLGKLNKTKKRVDTLLGDSLILAASVVYLGPFSMKERKAIRKEMAEYLTNTTGGFIKCGAYWIDNNGINNCRVIRQVLKECGVGGNTAEDLLLSSLPQGILSQETFIESIFMLMFSPSCPYIIDPTGALQEYLSSQLLGNIQVQKLYGSDKGVSQQIEQIMRGNQFAMLNDLNDCSSTSYGLCQDESLLGRLAHITHNGFEFKSELLRHPSIQSILTTVHTTHSSVNKRISVSGGQPHILSGKEQQQQTFSFYQVQIFSPRFDFVLNSDYMARATMLVAIDDDEGPGHQMGTNSAWVDIKEIMLQNFLPEEAEKLRRSKDKIRRLENLRCEITRSFENAFLIANQDTLQKLGEYSLLKQSVEDIRYYDEEKRQLSEDFQAILAEHPLLSSYANVIAVMFQSLKKISKIAGEVTYSWKTFVTVIDQILAKTIRDLTARIQQQNNTQHHQSSTSIIIDTQGRLTVRSTKQLNNQITSVDFSLDEEFFSTQVMPQIFGAIQASIKSELAPLFRLILAVKISYKKKEISEFEVEYFFRQLFQLKNFEYWRNIEGELVSMEDRVEKTKFLGFKRDLIKLYPEHGRKIIDTIEKDIGQSFTYKQANNTLNFKVFGKNKDFSKFKLFQQINIGFICPDHEFKAKLTQLVYEQLSSVFHFSEEPMKLSEFVKLASWWQPIALIPQPHINTINTLCSVATLYGVNLEILRSSDLPDAVITEHPEAAQLIQMQLKDYTHSAYSETSIKDAATYQRVPLSKAGQSACQPKVNVETMQRKENLRLEEKAVMGAYKSQDPLEVLERCASSGTWVFISSLRFPTYWHKLVATIEKLREQGKLKNTFRLFIDLHGCSQNEIPDSFLFTSSVSFHITQKGDQETAGGDIWSSILDPVVLAQLTEYSPSFAVEDVSKPQAQPVVVAGDPVRGSLATVSSASDPKPKMAENQEQYIKDEQQRELFNEFMKDKQSEAEVTAKEFVDSMKDHDAFLAEQPLMSETSHTHSLNLRQRTKRLEAALSGENSIRDQTYRSAGSQMSHQLAPDAGIQASIKKSLEVPKGMTPPEPIPFVRESLQVNKGGLKYTIVTAAPEEEVKVMDDSPMVSVKQQSEIQEQRSPVPSLLLPVSGVDKVITETPPISIDDELTNAVDDQ